MRTDVVVEVLTEWLKDLVRGKRRAKDDFAPRPDGPFVHGRFSAAAYDALAEDGVLTQAARGQLDAAYHLAFGESRF